MVMNGAGASDVAAVWSLQWHHAACEGGVRARVEQALGESRRQHGEDEAKLRVAGSRLRSCGMGANVGGCAGSVRAANPCREEMRGPDD